jgi:hypothetical protein
VAGEKVFRLKLWPDELKQATLPPETFPPIRYALVHILLSGITLALWREKTENLFWAL